MKKCSFLFWPALFSFWMCPLAQHAIGQIVPDATLPVNSTVTPQGNTNLIEGGTAAGSNLFHSFREFSVPTGTEVLFNNKLDIQNIFTRVTGNSISNIDGLIRANGVANLFLLNPNGIIFGPNAQLNIGGSFFASTANTIKFADRIEFSTTNTQTPLLSVNVPVGLQYGANPGEIRVQGKGQEFGTTGTKESFDRSLNPLEVRDGNTLALVGGNVIIDGGILQSAGGRVELGGLAGEGTVGVNTDVETFNQTSLQFPDSGDSGIGVSPVPLANVSIINKSGINAIGDRGGSITISGRNIDISGNSLLTAGIGKGLGTTETIAGDISLNAIAALTIASSTIENNLNPDAIGNSGNININTESLTVTEGSLLSSTTFGQGNGGNITIIASDRITFNGTGNNGASSQAASTVKDEAVGNAGDINITTKSLHITEGALLNVSTFGKGNAGKITIVASDTVSFDGQNSEGASSQATSSVEENGFGDGGSINITTNSLQLTGGAVLNASTLGQGKAGDITIIASDTVSFDGVNSNGGPGGVASTVGTKETNAVGAGGNINITAKSVSVTGGAILGASTFAQGKAGNINIIASDSVSFDGTGSIGSPGGALSTVEENAVGEGGNINITTNSLSVRGGATLGVTTFAKGNAGNVTIVASDRVSLDGKASDSSPTTVVSTAENSAVGNGGSIDIVTGYLSITNGASLNSTSLGNGTAGNITVAADSIYMENRAEISTETVGGDITTQNQASIELQSSSLILRQNSRITTNAQGNNIIGGNIAIDTDTLVALENSDISANSLDDRGGTVTINAQGIFGAQSRTTEELQTLLNTNDTNLLDPALLSTSDITATGADSSLSGTVTVNTPDVNPSAGLIELPGNLIDATALVTSSCRRGNSPRSQFTVIGRGGLPPSPLQALESQASWIDLRLTPGQGSGGVGQWGKKEPSLTNGIVEATGWRSDPDGKVVLTANTANVTPHSTALAHPNCQTSQN
ncbi:S-layer family protein [Planktothrix sp. FACHB-1355]|uniref:S-layer family protein n=1 Tax=Aerosakkonema funiforme FACHB-1375 TaxID=2949571 RepID=A0A926ZMF2_9CYAN|nr:MULTISPECIES: S-layer family protein [Oscillatoriales]MBD2186006.1 S-layer family protein [Aerosakkonema funiforme FACHB-1375]MBD3559224.1 S-layer family protein [Planktothrix sp. FACHB-1355]